MLASAIRRIGVDDLVDALVNAKSGDLQTVLLEVMRRRAEQRRPRDLVAAHGRRFCAPSDIPPRHIHRIERSLYDAAEQGGFELLDLSPVAPLGVCSVLAPCDQNKILATTRNLEVASDPTNVLALEAAIRRSDVERVDLASHHRALRVQAFDNPVFRAHFRLFAMLSMFASGGSLNTARPMGRAEAAALATHLDVFRALLATHDCTMTGLLIGARGQPWSAIRDGIAHDGHDERIDDNAYYSGLCFSAFVRTPAGDELPLIDGGFVDWGARLRSSAKERTLISAIGSDVLARVVI